MQKKSSSLSDRERSFTLIELLITVSITAMIGLVVFSAFAAGFKIFAKVKDYNNLQTDVLLTLQKLENDLRNTFDFTGIGFSGDRKKIAFAGWVNRNSSLGRIAYQFNIGSAGTFIKTEQLYSTALLENQAGGAVSKVLAAVKDVDFSYYYLDPDTHKYDFKYSWSAAEGIPRVVKIRIIYQNENQDLQLEKSVFIPVSG
jgi:hypothetical protein